MASSKTRAEYAPGALGVVQRELIDLMALDLAEITPGASLRGDLGLDDLDVVELELAVGKREHLTFEDEVLPLDEGGIDGWQTVADVVTAIEKGRRRTG